MVSDDRFSYAVKHVRVIVSRELRRHATVRNLELFLLPQAAQASDIVLNKAAFHAFAGAGSTGLPRCRCDLVDSREVAAFASEDGLTHSYLHGLVSCQ